MRIRRELRKIPLFPYVPIVPVALFAGSIALSIISLVKVRRLSRSLALAMEAPA